VVKVNLGGVDLLTINTVAAMDSSPESTVSAVNSFNGLVFFIPRIIFHFSQFSSFPSMLSTKLGLAFFYISLFQTLLIADPFVFQKLPRILASLLK
jgi:hypothetical protein